MPGGSITVLDTAAFLAHQGLWDPATEYYTTESVIAEVLDKESREFLEQNKANVSVISADAESHAYIAQVMMSTGTTTSVSATDVDVLSLACYLHKKQGHYLPRVSRVKPVSMLCNQPETAEIKQVDSVIEKSDDEKFDDSPIGRGFTWGNISRAVVPEIESDDDLPDIATSASEFQFPTIPIAVLKINETDSLIKRLAPSTIQLNDMDECELPPIGDSREPIDDSPTRSTSPSTTSDCASDGACEVTLDSRIAQYRAVSLDIRSETKGEVRHHQPACGFTDNLSSDVSPIENQNRGIQEGDTDSEDQEYEFEESHDATELVDACDEIDYTYDDGFGAWITEDNFESTKTANPLAPPERDLVVVVCRTSDFALQNILLAIGITIEQAFVGRANIKKVTTFKHYCGACRSWAEREDSQFCKFCGHKSVRKVPIRTDNNGNEYCILRPARRKIAGNKSKPSRRVNSRHHHSRTPVTSEDMLQMGGRRFELLRQEKAKKKLLEQAKADTWDSVEDFVQRPLPAKSRR